nr:unnamed protein product [Callosobruchus analis]
MGNMLILNVLRNSGSKYFCYRHIFSIVLRAIADPYYQFIMVDIGSYVRHSDSAIFENSDFITIISRMDCYCHQNHCPVQMIPFLMLNRRQRIWT